MNLKRLNEWVEFLRNVAALLFMPAVSLMAAAIVAILMIAFAGHADPIVVQMVVRFLGWTLMGLVLLLGCALFWIQRRDLPDITIKTPGGLEVSLDNGDEKEVPHDQV